MHMAKLIVTYFISSSYNKNYYILYISKEQTFFVDKTTKISLRDSFTGDAIRIFDRSDLN